MWTFFDHHPIVAAWFVLWCTGAIGGWSFDLRKAIRRKAKQRIRELEAELAARGEHKGDK